MPLLSEISSTSAAPVPRRVLDEAMRQLRRSGYAFVSGTAAAAALGIEALQTTASAGTFVESWQRLKHDPYLADGGRYRLRRHASLIQQFNPATLETVAYRPHWQPKAYNHLHGGILRHFEPVEQAISENTVYLQLVTSLGKLFHELNPATPTPRWYIEAHQFRIDASAGIAKPTPEGAHRDGVDFVALMLIGRGDIHGGTTSIYDEHGALAATETLMQPWSLMLLDDARVTHATTPLAASGENPVRDTLVLTFRREGFLDSR